LYEFMAWLEASPLGHAMRGSGVWAYGVVNLTHILGVSSLFGAVLVLDLRLLGLWRGIPLASIAGPTVPVATAGFMVAVVSGAFMISTNATEYVGNPFLYVKFPAIGAAVLNVGVLNLSSAWRARSVREPSGAEAGRLAAAGGTSLLCWLAAIAAGRMIGYW
jgi:hypothetical protein